ncbi:glycosyltransferase family 2 protein [Thermoplasma sp.]|uniref:glycosyltransferase n=1 Tax=Thermoplasma sp. TaxID=1973142 RepID=UPI00127A8DB3|nr:glycosyltransferase family 2 protein [Thermoplasma sp.]KAA8923458.1 MAG: glycosyltransferase family 2 protein [Thermoplasma sp.]
MNLILFIFISLLTLIAFGFSYIGIHKDRDEACNGSVSYRILVIIPCRGLDYGFEENLRSIIDQDIQADYVTVVDSDSDPSLQYIKKVGVPYMLSNYECSTCSGKVRAISTALKAHPDYDVYVIADSDIRVKRDWLRHLVCLLSDDHVGISTTFPYFHPVGGLASSVKAVWGTVGQSLMESRITRFGWGGSLAFRRNLLDSSMPFFSESVSDDSALTAICKSKGLRIAYVRESRPVVYSPESWPQFWEWSNRQTALSISASPKVFRYGVVFYSLDILLFISAIVLATLNPVFLYLLTPKVIGIYRMYDRAVIKRPSFAVIFMAIPFIYMANLLTAHGMKHITWRGNTYELQKFAEK